MRVGFPPVELGNAQSFRVMGVNPLLISDLPFRLYACYPGSLLAMSLAVISLKDFL